MHNASRLTGDPGNLSLAKIKVSTISLSIFFFPNIDNLPRHPSQIYEAISEGLLIFIILFSLKKYSKLSKIPGVLSALFVILYGFARLFCEYFREPDSHIGFLFDSNITMGQILSMPVILAANFAACDAPISAQRIGNIFSS